MFKQGDTPLLFFQELTTHNNKGPQPMLMGNGDALLTPDAVHAGLDLHHTGTADCMDIMAGCTHWRCASRVSRYNDR